MKYTQIPVETFNQLQINAGILLNKFDPATPPAEEDKLGATTGGTELAARLLKYKLRNLSIGRLCLSIDVTVICLYAFTFRSVNNALYGIVAMYISSLTMDTVVYGSINAKIAYIISGHSGEVAKRLLGLDLGITLLDGRGGYSGDRKQVVLCAFKRSQFAVVKATVTAIDPNAFIIVCEAHEVLGEGFGAYTPDSLASGTANHCPALSRSLSRSPLSFSVADRESAIAPRMAFWQISR